MPLARFVVGVIYYVNLATDADRAFERAAKWATRGSIAIGDLVELVGVTTKQDFVNAWNGILNQANLNHTPVDSVDVFTHASKGDSDLDGLEFADGPGGSTLTQADILALPRLPWRSGGGFMYLHGCNCGLVGSRGWCPAQAFLNGQGIGQVNGEAGYAYFSKEYETYVESSPSDQELYLWAYRRMRNGLGDGGRIEPSMYSRNHFRNLIDQVAKDFVAEKRRLGKVLAVRKVQLDGGSHTYRLALTEMGSKSEIAIDREEFSEEVLAAMNKARWPEFDGSVPEDAIRQVMKAITSRC